MYDIISILNKGVGCNMKNDKLQFQIMNCQASKDNAVGKLRDRLKSLMSDMQYELEKIEKEGQDYYPTNSINLMGGEAMMIENLIGKIAGLNESLESLKSLEE